MSVTAQNLTLLTDLYELTMMQGYFKNPVQETVIFDAFYRVNPCGNGFAIAAGLDQVIDYIKNLHFSDEDVAYLDSLGIFEKDFLEYLRGFRFTGDIYAIPEGTAEAQLKLAAEAGAEYIISPNVDTAIIRATKAVGLISIPGAFTPSEIAGAYQAGADFVKLFPADCVDLKYIKAVRAPINHIPLLAVSGVTPENLGDYLNAGMAGAGIGSILVTKADVANEDYDAIAQRAARYVAVVESV